MLWKGLFFTKGLYFELCLLQDLFLRNLFLRNLLFRNSIYCTGLKQVHLGWRKEESLMID